MGDREGWTWPNGFYPNGLLPDGVASVTRGLDQERWSRAEQRTAELIACIQPNQLSEDRRNAVARYVKCLIMKCFPCQVFTFGSVPLKTYLPDGDIDLTAFSNDQNLKDNWAKEVLEILESEEKIEDAEFHVKEVQYINAEVKIIKCLVENIVVDISINQLGGLCTLCFLEEVDNLINHNHLFKRSIILIKAWCYYESRILGAHHGLISTYALETLVLYIFHLYNNSFAGPLEVLYRFLEFFSKFDWDNFCVSLWGPVPISSLPNMAVDPPRNDGEDLSLSKLVYACISAYTVLLRGQENQEQPFILKHFNIIDPLRMNNNLGRSVNKGNFFRIRSALAFGARRLARLLECPKENLIAELNQFFMNTWDRHGKGHRPDAHSPDLYGLRSGNSCKIDRLDSFRNDLNSPRDEVTEKSASYESGTTVNCSSHTPCSVSSQHGKNSLIRMYRSSNVSAVSCTENLKAYTSTINSVSSNQKHHDLQNICSNENTQADRRRGRNYRSYSSRNVHVRCQFARTHSSPELTDTSSEVSFRGRSSHVSESGNGKTALTKSDNSRRRNLCPEVLENHIAKFPTEDHPSSRWSSSHQSFDSAVNLHGASNCYYGDSCMGFMEKDCHHVAERIHLHQEEQDFVNMMASRCNINGQMQMQVNLASAPPLVPIPPSLLASLGYAQKNLAGSTPTNIPAYESPWISNMHYSQGLFPLPVSQYYHGIGVTSNQEEMTKLVDNNLISKELNQEDGDHGSQLKQNLHSLRCYDCSNRSFQAPQLEDRQQFSSGSNSSAVNNTDSYSLKDHRLVKENRGLVGETYGNNSTCERIWETDVNSGASSRFLSSHAIPSRTKSSSENFRDGSPSRSSKSTLDKHGRKSVSSTDPSTTEELAENGWRYEGVSVDPVSSQVDEDRRECIPLSTVGCDVVESSVSGSAASSHVQTHQIPGHGPALVNGSNSVLPVASVLVGSESQHIASKNLGVSPFSLYPMWAGVPFLTMSPVYNLPTETGSSSVSANHYDGDEEFDNCQRGQSNHSLDSTESLHQSEVFNTCNSMKDVASEEPYEQHKTDILNSDYVSHWQNLQYGWFCQNAGLNGPLLYTGSVVVPPMYPQRHFPWDDPGRPPAANLNLFTQLMGYGPSFISVSSFQPDTSQPVGVYEHCGDEMPGYRSGTGTYLPNHKNFFRGQQSSKTRNHRGRYGCERKNHVGEREENWNTNSKQRFAGHGQGRNLVEKPNKRMDRGTVSNNQSDKSWDLCEHEYLHSYYSHNGSSSISNSMNHSSSNVASAMYPLPVVNPSGVSPSGTAVPSLVMLYPYDHKMGYGSPAEQLEFGSLGAVHFSGIDDASHVDKGSSRIADEQHSIQDDSELSSQDQPSSPQLQRRA